MSLPAGKDSTAATRPEHPGRQDQSRGPAAPARPVAAGRVSAGGTKIHAGKQRDQPNPASHVPPPDYSRHLPLPCPSTTLELPPMLGRCLTSLVHACTWASAPRAVRCGSSLQTQCQSQGMNLSVDSLHAAMQRVRSEVLQPYGTIRMQTTQMSNLHRTTDMLRHVPAPAQAHCQTQGANRGCNPACRLLHRDR